MGSWVFQLDVKTLGPTMSSGLPQFLNTLTALSETPGAGVTFDVGDPAGENHLALVSEQVAVLVSYAPDRIGGRGQVLPRPCSWEFLVTLRIATIDVAIF